MKSRILLFTFAFLLLPLFAYAQRDTLRMGEQLGAQVTRAIAVPPPGDSVKTPAAKAKTRTKVIREKVQIKEGETK